MAKVGQFLVAIDKLHAGPRKQPAQAPFQRAAAPASGADKNGPVTSRQPSATSIAKAPPPPPAKQSAPANNLPRGSVLAGTRPQPSKAPAPVVPVLRKGAKATQKKRA